MKYATTIDFGWAPEFNFGGQNHSPTPEKRKHGLVLSIEMNWGVQLPYFATRIKHFVLSLMFRPYVLEPRTLASSRSSGTYSRSWTRLCVPPHAHLAPGCVFESTRSSTHTGTHTGTVASLDRYRLHGPGNQKYASAQPAAAILSMVRTWAGPAHPRELCRPGLHRQHVTG